MTKIIGLKITRLSEDESWFDCAMRYARKHGLEDEVKEDFEIAIRSGVPPEEAAFDACYEWDVCDVYEKEG
jgi:hypothetical protein